MENVENLKSGSYIPAEESKELDFTSVLAVAAGSGMLGGSLLGIGGALLGSVIGAGFGYWAQVSEKGKSKRVREKALTH